MSLRSFLTRTLRGVTIRRRLPAGPRILLAPSSQLKHLRPGRAGFDAQLLDWADEFAAPGAKVWDIGANLGCFGFSAAGRGASVLMVEPDPYLVHLLMRSRGLNPGLEVDIVAAALSDARGLSALEIASGGRAANRLAEFGGNRAVHGRTISRLWSPVITLDELFDRFGRPDLIKIDVEGAEAAVLRGANRLLAAKPVLIIETGNETEAEIAAILSAAGYLMRDLEADGRPVVETPAFSTLATAA
jgi:FkbM family methyltransferase